MSLELLTYYKNVENLRKYVENIHDLFRPPVLGVMHYK